VLVKMSSTAGDVILIRAIMQLSKRDQPQKWGSFHLYILYFHSELKVSNKNVHLKRTLTFANKLRFLKWWTLPSCVLEKNKCFKIPHCHDFTTFSCPGGIRTP
jgi:hypothetical protein